MRILILSNSDSGLYQFRKELIEALVKENEVYCCTPDSDGYVSKLESLDCKCITISFNRRGKNPFKDFGLLNHYRKIIKTIRPNAVLTYTIKPNVYGGIASRLMHIPFIANITGLGTSIENGGMLRKITITLYKIGLKNAKCVFFQNENNKDMFIREGIVKANCRLIPGSGVNAFTHYYEDYPITKDRFYFLFVGRVMRDKGIEELLTSIKQLSDDNYCVFLDVVGGCDENYYGLLKQYEGLGLIKYHGKQNDVHNFYANADCVVLPSYHEGMANVMLEAASTGRPVITTRIPGCIETFDEGITGFGCEPKDINSLVFAMKKMMDTPWEKRKEMGKAGRVKVETEFNRSIIVKAYLEELSTI